MMYVANADSGAEALATFRPGKLALAVTDVVTPEVDGLELGLELSRILRQPVKTQIPLNGELCHGVVATNVHA